MSIKLNSVPAEVSSGETRVQTSPKTVLALGALAVLFAGELAWSLWDWHKVNRTGFGLAAIHSLAFLGFFWATLLLLAERSSRCLAWLENKNHAIGIIGKLVAALFVAVLWNILITSLVMRYALGCYLNLSLLRFAATNMTHGLFEHMMTSQRSMLIGLLIFLVLSTVYVFIKTFRTAAKLNLLGDPRSKRPVLYTWLLLSVLFTVSMAMLNRDESRAFKVKMMNHLSFKLDPLLNFGLNCYDFYRQSKYESMLLEESRLASRAAPFAQPPTAMSRKPNIIFFQIESFRADLIGQERQGIEVVPNLNRLARQGTTFKNAYAAATHTSLSNPSIPSSLYPLRKDLLVAYEATDPWPRTLIYDVLKPYGYATAYIASEFESWCGMDNFLITPSLDLMLDSTARVREQARLHPETVHGNTITTSLVPDRLTAQSAIDWMDVRVKSKQPFYITISLTDSHFPYKTSLTNANWFQPSGVPSDCTFNDYPRELKEQIRNTYLNSIHGIDILIGQILDSLHKSGADENTIFVVYGDHGESFYENDLPSHGNLPYDPSARTCLIMTGKNYFEAKTETYPASLIDAVPTVLARLGLQSHPNFQGIDVLSSNRPPLNQRCLYVHVDGLVNADGVVAAGRWKYFEDNGKGDRYLYDLSHDPGEAENLVEAKPDIADLLGAQLADWRTSQLVYYRAARYYTKFYPPRPQMLKEPGLP